MYASAVAGTVSNSWKMNLMATKMALYVEEMLASERKYALMMPTLATRYPVIKKKKRGKDTASGFI